mmetsp:Transcript_14629/g.21319  ORF Transcript_14629/g.21319 Transcript_14629/m.21319 type:complete len:103 (+) Transcript_14629:42-350(+)
MEERLRECFLEVRDKGSPQILREKVLSKLGTEEFPKSPQYEVARSQGLCIAEAEFALALAEQIRKSGLEQVIAKLQPSQKTFKRKRSKVPKEDTPTKKKTKR